MRITLKRPRSDHRPRRPASSEVRPQDRHREAWLEATRPRFL